MVIHKIVGAFSLLGSIYEAVVNLFTASSTIRTLTYTLTRPADTTAYAAGDVIANATSEATLPELTAAKAAGAGIKIDNLRVQINNTLWAGTRLRIHIYRDSVTALNDNAAFTMLQSNADKRVGFIDVTLATAEGGATDSVAGINLYDKISLSTVANKLYFIPQILDAKTPISGQVFKIQFGVIQTA